MTAPVLPLPLGKSGVDADDLLADVLDLAPYPHRQAEGIVLALAAVAAEVRALRVAVERRRRWFR